MAINARQIALQGLREWDDTSQFADQILARLTKKYLLVSSNRSLVQELFYGTLRNLESVDYVIEALRRGSLSSQALWVLRLGVYQLLHTDIPEHAALNETVSLMGKNQRGFVNAILRNTQRQKEEFLTKIAGETLDIRESHPEWLIERWTSQIGPEATETLCTWNNKPAPVYARLNPLAPLEKLEAVRSSLEPSQLLEGYPEFFKIEGQIPTEWLAEGLIYIQDPSTAGACELLDAAPGESILDACAAPGGKAAFLAGSMKNEGEIVAVDNSSRRIERLQENLDRMLVKNTTIRELDWQSEGEIQLPQFDGILVDAPCSNTGVMRRRIDVRWRLQPWDFDKQVKTQLEICRSVIPHLRPGGRLVYSTCSIDREENEGVVEKLLTEFPELTQASVHKTLPWVDAVDGSFAIKLVKAE